MMVPLHKNKGDIQSCNNHRGIKLLSHTMKVLERVIELRLRRIVTIFENQFGFMLCDGGLPRTLRIAGALVYRDDDILPKLMTFTGSHEDLFRKEIAKYDHICEEISQNIEAQEQLLLQIQVQKFMSFSGIYLFSFAALFISTWELLLSFNVGILVWALMRWVVSLHGLGQSSSLELAFGIELNPRSISLHGIRPSAIRILATRVLKRTFGSGGWAQTDEFASIFNLEDYKASCERIYKQIEAAILKYQEIKENINEGLKFYVTLQEAINNVKQQCSDFVMTRNMQCREMIEDVQRQISGLSFQDGKSSSGYTSVGQGHQPPRSNPQVPTETGNIPNSSRPHQAPAYQSLPQQPAISEYGQTSPPYSSPQPPAPPYHFPGQGQSYPYQQPQPHPHPQHQPQPPPNHEYSQPAYPGWRGPYYNVPP
ncbi:putative nuclear pore complex protein Nup98-Nup96-like [Capsicum annuum]|nr:putative nuclear pore complex protein Nup98-Nup96-like [Capsicum annuum]